jgi:hypothetical protein
MSIILSDNPLIRNRDLINALVLISQGFEDDDEDEFAEERFVLQTSAARIITLTRVMSFFFTGFVVSNAFWLYNYLSN